MATLRLLRQVDIAAVLTVKQRNATGELQTTETPITAVTTVLANGHIQLDINDAISVDFAASELSEGWLLLLNGAEPPAPEDDPIEPEPS